MAVRVAAPVIGNAQVLGDDGPHDQVLAGQQSQRLLREPHGLGQVAAHTGDVGPDGGRFAVEAITVELAQAAFRAVKVT
jgi:hypothetical protein